MSGVSDEALLCRQREAQAFEQLVHRTDKRAHFLRRLLFRKRRQVAVRTAFDLAAERAQRRKSATDRVPQNESGHDDQ